MKRLVRFICMASIIAAFAPRAGAANVQGSALQYNRDIRPLLAENCFACHGSDRNRRQAGLRLDDAVGAFMKLPSGNAAIVPGRPAQSALVERIKAVGPLRMPPKASARQLTRQQIVLLTRWVAEGGKYEKHWAYVPPSSPRPPAVRHTSWIHNSIDNFVLAGIETAGLAPSPPASRAVLFRRLSLDITGLPPSPADVARFEKDKRPEAVNALIERLLTSPHYGERMAAGWLDVVRYADTDGYHGDRGRSVYPFRDWVIDAFNRNMPFNRFTTEQIAGDLIPGAGVSQRVAAGYNRLAMVTREGGAQAKEYLAKYTAERIRSASSAWLGSTLGCAECHDHKFDPFSAKDFYRFGAFFADIKQSGVYGGEDVLEPSMPVPSPDQARQLAAFDSSIAAEEAKLATAARDLEPARVAWEGRMRSGAPRWTPLAITEVAVRSGNAKALPDGSVLVSGPATGADVYKLSARLPGQSVAALRIEALPDPGLPAHGPGRAANGNFVLGRVHVTGQYADGHTGEIALTAASATFEQSLFAETNPYKKWTATSVIDPHKLAPVTGWAILPQAGMPNTAIFETAEPPAARLIGVTISLEFPMETHSLGRFRISTCPSAGAIASPSSALPVPVANAIEIDPARRTPEQQGAITAYFAAAAPELTAVRARIAAVKKERESVARAVPTMLVTVSVPPMPQRVLARGNWMDESGEVVTPGVPHFLPDQPSAPKADRLTLARWLVSRKNPLTARVFVNRVWMQLFGAGIVRTPGDFGTQGAWPTHPELLDWLATRFMDSGWDIKALVRTIARSAAYQQASACSPRLRETDPYNKLIARQTPIRMDAEMIRDNALEISGLLCETIGGRSVKPYQPDGYWDHCNTFAGPLIYDQDHGDNLYRRGLYTYWKRTFLHPALLAFDAPTREECTVDRPRSNTPLQALVLLNDPTYVEAARVLAARMIHDGGKSPAGRIEYAYRRALSRPPRPLETSILAGLYSRSRVHYAAAPAEAQKLMKIGEYPAPAGIDATELAAWTSVARAILNTHETITRE